MIQKLKRKLVFIFGLTTSSILLVVILILFLSNYRERIYRMRANYDTNIITLFDQLKSAQNISSSWISRIEKEMGITILIEDNSIDLKLLNTIPTRIAKEQLKEKLRLLALRDGLDCSNPVFQSAEYQSKTYHLYQHQATSYYGTLMNAPISNGYRTIYLIKEVPRFYGLTIQFVLRYLIISLIGCTLLLLFSRYFMHLVLRPLEENQTKQREFIASVSHEMKSPLTVITTGISNLKTELTKDGDPKQQIQQSLLFIPTLENECSRASRLINDMLLLATTDSHTWQLNKTIVDMETLLIELFDFYSIYESSLNRIFQFELCDDSLYSVVGDKERIKQILTILIDNGYRYTPADKGITLKAYNAKQSVHIEIIDYGIGIDDANKELVFERFYRMDGSRSDKNNFGLGLSIAKQLVELHHGKIYVTDTVGGGATFCVDFPKKQ